MVVWKMFLNYKKEIFTNVVGDVLCKRQVEPNVFLQFLDDLLLFYFHYLVICIAVCSHTQIDLRYFDNLTKFNFNNLIVIVYI